MMVIRQKIWALGLIFLLGCFWGLGLPEADAVRNESAPVQNLEFINVDLRQVFRSLAATGRFNVILDRTVKGNVSIAFKSGITAQEAVVVIARNYGYKYQWMLDSKAVFIGNPKNFSGSQGDKALADIPLKYIDAALAASSVEIVIPKERIKPDSGGRQLIVFGSALELENIREIIAKIDRFQAKIDVEVKVAEVNDDFWRKFGMDSKVVRSHIGIYPISEVQKKELSVQNLMQALARRELTLFDNQEGKLFIGDAVKIRKPIEKNANPSGSGSPAPEIVDMGTTMNITSWVGEGNKITLQIKETTLTGTISPASVPKVESVGLPGIIRREVTSIISIEAGQTFILTGIISRDEFDRLKKQTGAGEPSYFPVLNELFTVGNSWPASLKTNSQVIAMITPKFLAGDGGTEFPQNNGQSSGDSLSGTSHDSGGSSSDTKTGIQNSDGKGNPANAGDSITVFQDSDSPSPKPDSTSSSITMVEYWVKKSDTLTGISAKFNVESQAIITANRWESQSVIIMVDAKILIPVPDDRIYEIKPKETLWRIAKRYGVAMELLQDLNDIVDIEKVKAGQKIVLPMPVSQIKDSRF